MVHSLRELQWREEKGGERGSLNEEVCERPCPKRRKRRGPVQGRGRESRADKVREKERKRTTQMDKASAAQCHGQTRMVVLMGPGADGIRRERGNSDSASVAWVS